MTSLYYGCIAERIEHSLCLFNQLEPVSMSESAGKMFVPVIACSQEINIINQFHTNRRDIKTTNEDREFQVGITSMKKE